MLKKSAMLILLLLNSLALSDTFMHKTTNQSFDGFMLSKQKQGKTLIKTAEGVKPIDIAEYNIERNRKGRDDKVIVLPLDGPLQYIAETQAFNDSLTRACNMGPLFIVIQIDSPGGRIDLCRDICIAIDDVNSCDIYAFIKGGKNGGAYSAAAAVALACDKIYMTADTAIGAATPYQMTKAGVIKESDPELLNWFAGVFYQLAEDNNRPGILAAAMVDKEINAVEINVDDKREFVWQKEPNPDAKIIKTWSEKGMLLTLTAGDAAETGICDGIVSDMDELMTLLNVEDAKIINDNGAIKARLELEAAQKRIDQTYARVMDKIKSLSSDKKMEYSQAYHMYNAMIRDLREAIALSEKYPDLKQHEHLPELRKFLDDCEKSIKN